MCSCKMAATAPTGEIWLGTIAQFTCFVIMYIMSQVSCFYDRMHDSLIFGQLDDGL